MKKITSFLLKQYGKMSGDKKVRISLNLSKTVRRIRKDGVIAQKLHHGT